MNKNERRETILELLRRYGTMAVGELSGQLSVTEATIRSDFKALFSEGLINRVYGGATSAWRKNPHEESLRQKENRNLKEKCIIGKLAASLIGDSETIMLDSGTTTNQVARCLVDHKDLTVITNGLNVLNTMIGMQNINLYTVGGQVGHRSYSIIGSETEKDLERYNAKTCVVSVDGVCLERGLTNNVLFEANITATLIRRAERTILVSDHSKIGKICLVPICPFTDVDIFVTDDKTPKDFLKALEDLGITVYVAESEDSASENIPVGLA